MIYGDNPLKINQRKDTLSLNVYTTVPDITAILQSSNLYVYCMSNAVVYFDSNGNMAIALAVAEVAGAAAVAVVAVAAVASPAGQKAMSDAGDALVAAGTWIAGAVEDAWS